MQHWQACEKLNRLGWVTRPEDPHIYYPPRQRNGHVKRGLAVAKHGVTFREACSLELIELEPKLSPRWTEVI